jgi:hypothetical protein
MNPFYNLPPTQRETQRFVDEFNADERLWRKLEPRRRARRKILTDPPFEKVFENSRPARVRTKSPARRMHRLSHPRYQ